MASNTTTQTALCLIPPEDVWEEIQSIRSIHDKAYPRWMPHINLLYPFTPEGNFEEMKKQLAPIVNRKKPFHIQFDQSSLDYFQQKGENYTYHVRPKDSTNVIELQKSIQNQLSHLFKTKRPFEAHLTLGQTTTTNISEVMNVLKGQWKPVEFLVDRIYMISRENHPENLFTIKDEILLLDQPVEESPSVARNYLWIISPNAFVSKMFSLFQNTSFRASKPCRMVLAEYGNDFINSDLRAKLQSVSEFTLEFGRESLHFDENISRLFLKPTNMESIHQLNVFDDNQYEGTLTLGELQANDFAEVNDRYKKNWTVGTNQFSIDRIHLVDTNGRFQFIFRLKNSS